MASITEVAKFLSRLRNRKRIGGLCWGTPHSTLVAQAVRLVRLQSVQLGPESPLLDA
jgi:hypothetical protein